MGLGRGGEKYCVVMPDEGGVGKPAPPPKGSKYRYPTTKGGLGTYYHIEADTKWPPVCRQYFISVMWERSQSVRETFADMCLKLLCRLLENVCWKMTAIYGSNGYFGDFVAGDTCGSSSECSDKTADGQDNLCCQKITRYRQKARTICDRVTPISKCLP